ncbi:ATP-binding protein [Bacillus pseudomycoides]|uniref:ATP-binding protein n=1 Tax=Bacillus pseudomycoides TaxID=64104 RepID=UPI000BEE3227|nr:ATP-binding protein [Bacillus pseudomycoides]PDY45113.1 hypothetical protein CON79_21970 [Bacillus pseudomycoides]PEJ23254.1 hypothetical protein CN887_21160 [Bacillus pseudomycoides]PGD96692.1 hypothetical protein COM50_13700 [Bacillus pseudomycoides]PHB48308.1 hypothetical protein COE83_09490 [Bacillus pseudomycoides]PHE64596.1 hypothetical protein COF69_23995 [Bacillus pseudomycoides]
MKGTLIGRSKKAPAFIKPKWHDMSKQNAFVMGQLGSGISHHFVFAEENRNILVRGGVGKGKTTLLKQLLEIVLDAKQKVIVLDGPHSEYLEFVKSAKVIELKRKKFLSLEEQEQCKQYDVVIIDEALDWYHQDPVRFLTLMGELEQVNIRIFASFQAIPEELIQKFDVYLELDTLIP